MNAPAKLKAVETLPVEPARVLTGLRAPFPPNQISKLPKESKAQADERKADRTKGVNCTVCGGWHHKNAVHLDYVGHAALTDRLLDTDPEWSWEPLAFRDGLPAFDQTGGLWIRLTVNGVSRLGYGHAAAKPQMDPGAREKEVIGDALRNAAMRFGAALDLWHKGDLHAHDEEALPSAVEMACNLLRGAADVAWFKQAWETNKDGWKGVMSADEYAQVVAVMREEAKRFAPSTQAAAKPDPAAALGEDDIPAEFK